MNSFVAIQTMTDVASGNRGITLKYERRVGEGGGDYNDKVSRMVLFSELEKMCLFQKTILRS